MLRLSRFGQCVVPTLLLMAAVAGCPPSQPPGEPANATSTNSAPSVTTLARPPLQCPAGMAAVAGGTLQAEVPGGWRKTEIQITRFCLDTTEVSAIAFARCVADGACSEGHVGPDYDGVIRASLRQPDMTQLPMNYVDVERAQAFCSWAGKQLPKWYELVWAAQNAEQATKYPWGQDPPSVQRVCAPDCSTQVTLNAPDGNGDNWPTGVCAPACNVGTAKAGATAGGIHDLMGNVVELVAFIGKSRQEWAFGYVPSPIGGNSFQLATQSSYVGFRCAHALNNVRANLNADGPLPLPPAPTKLAAKPAPPPDVAPEEEGCSAEKSCKQLAPGEEGLVCATPDTITSCGVPGCVQMQRACGGNGECPEGYQCDPGQQTTTPGATTPGVYSPRQCVVKSCKSTGACGSRNLVCSGGRCVHRRCSRSKQCAGYCVAGRCWSEAGFCHTPNLKMP